MPSHLPIEVTAIEADGFHLMVEVLVNSIPARLLVDTGASRSVFDRDRIHRFFDGGSLELHENEELSTGLGTNDMQSHALYLDTLEIGDTLVKKYPAVVLDMSHVNQSYEKLGLPPIDGVLGSDILMKYGAVIDYGHRRMRINKRRKSLKVRKP
jgi:hypothetical protein